ncbi:MAG: ribosome silencing factor [Bacteroidetes bacterium]|nr:ribosome silencing factor [Bacteroidota bacterium]
MTDAKDLTSRQVVDAVVKGLEDKKGLEILFIDFAKLPNTVAEYFVIAHGSSNVHAVALADSVTDTVRKETERKPWNKEGFENAEWILLDYADVVVHIFQDNTRKFYKLEELWADTEITKVENVQ